MAWKPSNLRFRNNRFKLFLKFNFADLPHLPPSLERKAVRLFIQFGEVASPMVPILVFLLLRVMPCTPPFLLSMLPGCQNVETTLLRYLGRLAVHIFEAWMCFHIMYSGSAWLLFIFCVGIIFVLNFLQTLERWVNKNRKSTIFRIVLQEIMLPYSLVKIQSDLHGLLIIQLYRYAQILDKSFNSFLSEQIIPAIMFCNPVIEIFSLFVCISYVNEVPMPGFLVFPFLLVASGVINIVIITLASRIYGLSRHLLTSLERMTLLKRSKLMRRKLKACNKLKIEFGSNFIDNGTPVVLQNFCINQTLSLILLKDKL